MNKFCMHCGAALNENARFCNKCGTPIAPTQPTQATPPVEPPTMKYQTPPGVTDQPRYGAPPPQMPYQAPHQVPYQPQIGQSDLKGNVAAMLTYPLLFVTGILFLVLAPYNKDRFIRFHAYQSIFFTVALFILNIALGIASIVLPWFLENMLYGGLRLLGLAGIVWLMYEAYQGKSTKLPVVGDWAEQQARK
ncbi:MAG: zinc-ribbon domain-containing protein [Acidobacteria bacterium]|nr:zinc-ribbon domain-containing protein [Acidobacteriota bacterium]